MWVVRHNAFANIFWWCTRRLTDAKGHITGPMTY
jgi:hypothetical protein